MSICLDIYISRSAGHPGLLGLGLGLRANPISRNGQIPLGILRTSAFLLDGPVSTCLKVPFVPLSETILSFL